MPFQITREQRGIYKKFSGFVSKTEFLQSVFEAQSDPDYDRLAYSLNDFLAVSGHDVGTRHVETAAAYALGAELINPKIKIAIVCIDQDIRDLVGRFTAISNYPLALFTSVEEARNWLQLMQYA
jgi:hypothetical protein